MARQVYGKYELISRIASGGMAEVWLGRSSSIGGFEKQVALKRLHPRFGGQPELVSLFIEEAKLSVLLNHPNIVQIFDFGEVDGDYFIAMEFVDGLDAATLAKRARAKGAALPVGVAAYVVREVLEGLAHAHGNKKGRGVSVIHRDVSPHNVLISFDGQVKLSDFGIAKAINIMAATEGGQVMGKSAYMSPEQSRGEALTPATDIWSAGVMLHELLTGQRLFSRSTEEETLDAVTKEPILPPSATNTHVPPALDALTMQLLERDSTKRPESARKAAETLSTILRENYPTVDDYRVSEVVAELATDTIPPAPVEVAPTSTEGTAPKRTRSLSVSDEMILAFEMTSPSKMMPPPDVLELKKVFSSNPNLWVLYDIGQAYEAAGQSDRALGAYKVAMAKFAQVGLLVQAATIATKLIEVTGASERTVAEIERLPSLHSLSDTELFKAIVDKEDNTAVFTEYEGLFRAREQTKSQIEEAQIYSPAPIFSALEGPQLVRLVMALKRREYPAGTKIISEGETQRTFFFIGRGRVVVSTNNYEGRRVYLTSLADGDCFGEQAFFSGEPRNASVEAMEPVIALEVARDSLSQVIEDHGQIADELKAFYKERIAESLLARSALFGHLAVRERKRLAAYFGYQQVKAGAMILREGEHSDAFYALRHGKVEVYSGGNGGLPKIELATLGPGEVFGEVAALKGEPRTASVRAVADCELLKIEAGDLQQFLKENSEIRQLIEQKIETRAEETIQRIISS